MRARHFLKTVCLAGSFATPALPAAAQATGAQRIQFTESVAPLASGVRVLGEAEPSAYVKFQVALRLRNGAGLSAGNVAGRHLTPDDLDRLYLPTRAQYDAVRAWLTAQGLAIGRTQPSRLTIEASGTAAVVSRVLGVHFSRIMSEGQVFTAADSAPVLPAALAPAVLSINGLQPHLHAHHTSMIGPASLATPRNNTAPPYFAGAFISAYLAGHLGQGGARTTTAIVIDTFPLASDLTTYWATAGIAQSLANITMIQAVPGTLPGPSGEESMDAEIASSVSPASKIRIYASQALSYSNIDTTLQAIITDLTAGATITQVSISLGTCENNVPAGQIATDDNLFAVISALGASVFVSTGDSGSHECGGTANVASFFATSPNVTAVGGTSLRLDSAGNIASETGWSRSGGGLSTKFSKPAYQAALPYSMRAVPDLAADADRATGALIYVHGGAQTVGGTSLSTPIIAGLFARINNRRLALGKPSLGLLNGRIYPFVHSPKFRDIQAGSNGGYSAGVGYDLVTGIGTPKIVTLMTALVAQP